MAAGDLCTVSDAKALAKVVNVTDDTLFAQLVTQASDAVKSYLSLQVLSGTVTQTLLGSGQMKQTLREYPVTAVTSVTIDGTVIPQRTTPGGNGWFLAEQTVVLVGYVFIRNVPVVIVYVAGWTPLPTTFARATAKAAAAWYKETERLGMKSQGIAGTSMTTYDASRLPADVCGILDQYKRLVPA